jgi:hypothetical protein
MRQMLQNEPPWWSFLRKPGNSAWLQLFLASLEFKRWYDDSNSR